MLPTKESLTVEFKSERQRPQTDDEIVDNVVAMANTCLLYTSPSPRDS